LLWRWRGSGDRRFGGGFDRVEAEVVEDPLRDRRLGDEGDDLHPAVAVRTGEHVDREDLPEQIAQGTGYLLSFAGFARSGFSEASRRSG